MRGIRPISIILLCWLVTAAAPSLTARPSIGLKLGVTASIQHYRWTDIEERRFDWRHDPEIGLLVEWPVFKRFSVRSEISYVTKGMKTNLLTANDFGDPTIVPSSNYIRYVSVGVLLKARLPVPWNRFYALAGPRIDIQVGHHGETIFAWRYDDDDDFESTVFGLSAGLGQELQIGRVAIFLEGLYHFEFGYAYKLQNLTIHNQAFSILAGLRI